MLVFCFVSRHVNHGWACTIMFYNSFAWDGKTANSLTPLRFKYTTEKFFASLIKLVQTYLIRIKALIMTFALRYYEQVFDATVIISNFCVNFSASMLTKILLDLL